MAVIHCPGNQKEKTHTAKGNGIADKTAKEAARGGYLLPLIPALDLSQFQPEYSISDQERAEKWKFKEINNDWKINEQEINLLFEWLTEPVLKHIHETTQVQELLTCQKNNPKTDPHQRKEGGKYQGQSHFEDWEIVFTQMPKSED